jgi:metal iron transporter
MMALIPAMIVAVVVGKNGINALLVASQFVLSIVLPFVTLPLVYLTSNERVMSVPIHEPQSGPDRKDEVSFSNIGGGSSVPEQDLEKVASTSKLASDTKMSSGSSQSGSLQNSGPKKMKSFKNGRPLMLLGYLIFVCILAADVIAIISLAS